METARDCAAKPGDIVVYSPFGGGMRRVRVTHADPDIKNGRPGFDGVLIDKNGNELPSELAGDDGAAHVWGYDSQIVRIER